MQTELFTSIFNKSVPFISSNWKNKYAELLLNEHWQVIGERLFSFAFKNEIYHNPLPIFKEEVIADYPKHYQYFEQLKCIVDKTEQESTLLIANLIEKIPIESLLIILGQRKTQATITDEKGIPPVKEQLLERCFVRYNEQVCKAVRAREKHISRQDDSTFWGKMEGNPAEKEQATKAIIQKIMEEKTWWNVFTHYKHDVVYEIRIASGQGIRWKTNKLELIGFLEPFI